MAQRDEVTFQVKQADGEAQVPARGLILAPDFNFDMVRDLLPNWSREDTSLLLSMHTRLAVQPGLFLAGPVLGAPMAVMALEELYSRGAREIVFLGSTGCLTDELPIGALVAPARGVSTEGTSQHYPAPLAADGPLRERLIQGGLSFGLLRREAQDKVIWSTDGIYRETAELIAKQRAAGAAIVDMETTALMAAANFRGVALAALLVVSDFIADGQHHVAFHRDDFKAAVKAAASLAWRALADGFVG